VQNSASFTLDRPGYLAKQLRPEDAPVLQSLYEQCADFSLLSVDQPFSPTEAREEFDVLPDGKIAADKYIFGLVDSHSNLIGMIESIRHYPNDQTWWIGLMMLSPNQRGQGLGLNFYQAFEDWVSKQGIKKISLCVIEINELGLRFWKSLGFEVIHKKEPQQFDQKINVTYVMSRVIATTAYHSLERNGGQRGQL
jgi:GNAT superfamily N-acetyltransferase